MEIPFESMVFHSTRNFFIAFTSDNVNFCVISEIVVNVNDWFIRNLKRKIWKIWFDLELLNFFVFSCQSSSNTLKKICLFGKLEWKMSNRHAFVSGLTWYRYASEDSRLCFNMSCTQHRQCNECSNFQHWIFHSRLVTFIC